MKFDRYAANYDEGFMGKGSSRFYVDLIKKIKVNDGDRILDVGCGTGTILNYISKRKQMHGFGIDESESMLIKAREKKTGCTFLTGDAGNLPFEAASMDVITACMAYHHFPDQNKFRKEAMRVLKPGGYLYICDPRLPLPVRGFLNTFFKEAGFHSTRRNVKDFLAMGFAKEKIVRDSYIQVLCFRKV